MGGIVSAIAAAVDLEDGVHKLYANRQSAKDIGWHVHKMPTNTLVQGVQHVDDALVLSKIFCNKCLWNGIKQMWPEDIAPQKTKEWSQKSTSTKPYRCVYDHVVCF